MALEVRRVGQHEVGERRHLRLERVADDEERDLVLAAFVRPRLSFSIWRTSAVFIVEFHAMLAMKISSVSIGYGSPRQALVMTLCIMPCTASGYSHENALSMRTGVAVVVDEQIVGLGGPAERQRRRAACRA